MVIHHRYHARFRAFGLHGPQIFEIGPVHGDDQVKRGEIPATNLARAQVSNIHAKTLRRIDGPAVRLVPDVVTMGARRVNGYFLAVRRVCQCPRKETFRRR